MRGWDLHQPVFSLKQEFSTSYLVRSFNVEKVIAIKFIEPLRYFFKHYQESQYMFSSV